MSTERDTHFAGFAQMLARELTDASVFFDATGKGQQIITQRAYDLAYYISGYTSGCYCSGYIDPTQEVDVNSIPDRIEWPVEPKE